MRQGYSNSAQSTRVNLDEYGDLTCCHRATWCNPFLRETLVTNPIFKHCCTQCTYANLFWLATAIAMLFMAYAILYFYIGNPILPGGPIFGLFAVIVFAYSLGWSLTYVPRLHLPPVFGMLLAGIIVRNADWYNIHDALGARTSSKIRTFSVTFVMLLAGLNLTSTGLRQHPVFVLILALVPCTLELLMVTVSCKYFLEYPWSWAFLTGSIIACISPVVPVNCILALAERGYGEDTEIASLLFTAASIEDVHIVSIYSICFSFIFSNDKIQTQWWSYIPGGIRDFFLGVLFGAVLGLFFTFFPHRSHKYVMWYRIGGLVLGSLMCTKAATKIAITGGGFLATIIMSLIATTGWRILSEPFNVKPLSKAVHIMWHFMQPVLVGVIGADIDFRNWYPARFGFYVLCISLGLLVRIAFALFATLRTPFNTKERMFIALSWISKGTIQAALAPMTFEQAQINENPEELELAFDVVRISVIAIVFLAPLGAIIMMLTGPILLNKTSDEEVHKHRQLSYLTILRLQPVRQ